jgi:hypothetical protein
MAEAVTLFSARLTSGLDDLSTQSSIEARDRVRERGAPIRGMTAVDAGLAEPSGEKEAVGSAVGRSPSRRPAVEGRGLLEPSAALGTTRGIIITHSLKG